MQEKVNNLDERLRMVIDHTESIARTIDRNTPSRSASIAALISEQEDIRQLVEGLANRLDQSQGTSSAEQREISTYATRDK